MLLNRKNESNILVHKWIISSLIPLLSRNQEKILNATKQTIITLMRLVTSKLQLFLHRYEIKKYFLSTFESYSSRITASATENEFFNALSISVNIFSLLVDHNVKEYMMIDSSNDQKFESFARKIFYIITSLKTTANQVKADHVLSHLIEITYHYALDDGYIVYSKLRFFLELYHEIMRSPILLCLPSSQLNLCCHLIRAASECKNTNNLQLFAWCVKSKSSNEYSQRKGFIADFSKTFSFIELLLEGNHDDRNRSEVQFSSSTLEIVRLEILKSIKKAHTPLESLKLLKIQTSDSYKCMNSWVSLLQANLQKSGAVDYPITEWINIISSLGNFFCIVSGNFNTNLNMCEICENSTLGYNLIKENRPVGSKEVSLGVKILEKFIQNGSKSQISDICCLSTIFKLLSHFQPSAVSHDINAIFKFVESKIISPKRQVRLMAARIIPLYLISASNTGEKNTDVIFKTLSTIRLDQSREFGESVIMIWAQIALVSEGERLNVVLFKLIDYLGSSNSFHSSIAFHELEMIAISKHKTTWQLLSPCMPDLALMIVRQLPSKPAMGQKISDLVNVSVNTILARAESHIIPFLLTYYKSDVLGKVAEATGKEKLELITYNRSKVFAHLLTSVPDITEGKIMSILSNICPEIKEVAFVDLLNLTPDIWELLKLYSINPDNQGVIMKSIGFILKAYSPNKSLKEALSSFFVRNILGIVQLFSDTIHNTKGFQPYIEKMKAINAIELLVQISGPSIVSALPQICTSLQVGLEERLLRQTTLRCWRILIQHVEETHLVTLLDLSLAIVLQRWDDFDNECKDEAKRLLSNLFGKSENFKAKHVHCFFSLSDNQELLDIYKKIRSVLLRNEKPNSLLYDITRRLRNDNKYVIRQALHDLSRFLTQYQQEFYSNYLSKPNFAPVVSTLLSALMDILHKFKSNNDISVQCAKCLGSIGALDPTKFEIEKKKGQIIIASDFEDARETIKFLLRLIEKHLVPSFWASEDPSRQLFLAYSMQEYLKLCGLDSSNIDINNMDPSTQEYLLWSQFCDVSKSTLTPLVSSRYTASVSSYSPLSYPIHKLTKSHASWLRQFALDLLKRSEGTAKPIFVIFSSLIKDHDLSFSSFILPYAALHLIIGDNNEEVFNNIKTEILKVLSTDLESINNVSAESLRLSYESIFNLLDYFRKWIFARKQLLKKRNQKSADPAIAKVSKLMESIPQGLIAKRSIESNSYERAILYMELCYRSSQHTEFGDTFFSTLQNMYANIGDFDALDGVLKKFSDKSLSDRITELEYSDNWKMAQQCFEALGEVNRDDNIGFNPNLRLLKSLYDHNLYDKTLTKLNSLVKIEKKPLQNEWLNIGVESSMLLGKIEDLKYWILKLEATRSSLHGSSLINYHVGKALLSCQRGDLEALRESLNDAYFLIANHLSFSTASLNRNRLLLVLLHGLSDINLVSGTRTSSNFDCIKSLMNARMKHTGNDFRANWILLSLRRVSYLVSDNKFNLKDIGNIWIESSKLARKHNRLDLATSSIMQAIRCEAANSNIEFAKLLWAQGDRQRALKMIETVKSSEKLTLNSRDHASIQLRYTKWLDDSNNNSSTEIIEKYNEAIKIDPTWEKPYYALGKYYNKILDLKSTLTTEKINPRDVSGEYERYTISFYLKSMHYGIKYLYEALPKIITVWLDFAEHVTEVPGELQDSHKVTIFNERKRNLQCIHDEITKAAEKLPTYVWYTVLSQLLSRLLHPHKTAGHLIIMISNIVLQEYYAQVLWPVLAQYSSTQSERSRKAKKIIDLFSTSDSNNDSVSNSTILFQSKKLFNELIKVSSKSLSKGKISLSLKDDFDFDHSSTPCPLVVPVKTNFDITLPNFATQSSFYNPFPSYSRVSIYKFENRVDVLSSMQQPRHLYLKGSNGLTYSILCKPNDDLRKDAKLMEFTSMVDHLLKKDYESGKRNLHIKTYAVVPLNENHGIIEWVENSRTMRDILRTHYSNIGIKLDVPSIKKILDTECEVATKAILFKKQILDKYPPVLYQWFNENFPDPISWYDARNNYTRTTAVMSMVGYMLGLGDRHGENLLFNEKDGGILHVDFDCLFEKGLELTVPERVPFRLTKNMVDAFGIIGVEGTFRKSCEVTLTLLRCNETALMNILESFIHDPIMDWSRKRKNKNTPQSALSTIRRKIRGILDKEGLPVSVQGQAEFLIQQATSLENLCQMYIGWMAFW